MCEGASGLFVRLLGREEGSGASERAKGDPKGGARRVGGPKFRAFPSRHNFHSSLSWGSSRGNAARFKAEFHTKCALARWRTNFEEGGGKRGGSKCASERADCSFACLGGRRGVERASERRVGGPKVGGPKGGRSKISRFSLPPQFSFFPLLGVFSWKCCAVQGRIPHKVCVWVSLRPKHTLCVEFGLEPRSQFHERTSREGRKTENCGGRGKKSAILGGLEEEGSGGGEVWRKAGSAKNGKVTTCSKNRNVTKKPKHTQQKEEKQRWKNCKKTQNMINMKNHKNQKR